MAKHHTRSSTNEDNGDTTSDPIPNPKITSAPIQQAPMENRDQPAHDDLSSPYFLSTEDHPSLVLVSAPLTGPNFQSWHRAIFWKYFTRILDVLTISPRSEPECPSVESGFFTIFHTMIEVPFDVCGHSLYHSKGSVLEVKKRKRGWQLG
ncbi:hypothetical protein CsatB_009133 [Cannabis sativa]